MKILLIKTSITHVLAATAFVAFLAVGSGTAHAQDELGWVQLGDTGKCLQLGPGSAECSRVLWTFYIWPNIVRELNRVIGGVRPPIGPDQQVSGQWGRFTGIAFPAIHAGVLTGGGLGSGVGLPAPDDDDDWGPLGPVVRESLVLNSILLAELSGQQQGATGLSKVLFEREAVLRDLQAARGALQAALADVDKQISALQQPGRR